MQKRPNFYTFLHFITTEANKQGETNKQNYILINNIKTITAKMAILKCTGNGRWGSLGPVQTSTPGGSFAP
jgi:hypothetical protein